MRVLITGGFGYVGGRLGSYLAADGAARVRLATRSLAATPAWLRSAEVVQTQWSSAESLERACAGVDAVVHLAGMNAQDCAADPVAALDVNATATARLVKAAARNGVKRFVYLSTAHVYGSPLSGAISEDTCPKGLHPYAASHRAGEDAVLGAHARGELEGVVARLSNAFGAPAHADANCWMLLVNDLCRQALTTGSMVLRSSGAQRRDFIALTEVCRAIGHLLALPAPHLGDGLFNVGGGWSPTLLDMTELVAERVGVVTGHTPDIRRPHDAAAEAAPPLRYLIDKLAHTGFQPSGREAASGEIDALVRFCLMHTVSV